MKIKYTGLYAAMITAMIGVAGCSSSSTDTSSAANVTGRITGFGSVYVDGVEYETNGTTVTIDGEPSSDSDLRVGMLVTVTGSDDGTNGDAVSIEFDDDLEGVVTQTVAGGGLIVMGQSITVDNSTNLEGFTDTNTDGVIDTADLTVGDEVEISGYPDGNGGIHATYIELEGTYNGTDEIEVKGVVTALDPTTMTFVLGLLTVDYSAATSVDAGLADGVYVEVKANSAPNAGTLVATKVELEDGGEYGVDGDEGEELEVEGLITALDTTSTPNTITVNGQTFDVPAGIDVSSFSVGDMIDLDIHVVAGELVITDIEDEGFDDDVPGKIEVEAIVSATDTTNNTITLGGVTISVDPAQTIMLDHSDTPDAFFNLGSINTGLAADRIEVEAIPNAAGDGYIALSIERTNETSTTVELEGPVTIDPISGAMSIAGVSLDITSLTAPVPTGIVDGDELHANGALDGSGNLVVTVIELED